ncbi:Protein of unknown function [Pedobacter steynii]|uniref:DUF2992 domain-containing protein n=1 Tax=Pedobacter steynii TaxID=430522 RepID=A0A1G9USQ9_9SPHI|nr:YjdF family protein [Pedobacter steynii]NQX40864.1 YjdF family protein [Pedobacter steynii]SDM62949.1 Protein of unknown function [Pedobacter steynii]
MKSEHHLTILFEQPFWIALFERIENDQYCVARSIISTSEPEGAEITDFLNNFDFDQLQYTGLVSNNQATKEKKSFKKRQKQTQKNMTNSRIKHVYSKAQILLKEQLENVKKERKAVSKQDKITAEQRKFDIRQQKKKDRHKGH